MRLGSYAFVRSHMGHQVCVAVETDRVVLRCETCLAHPILYAIDPGEKVMKGILLLENGKLLKVNDGDVMDIRQMLTKAAAGDQDFLEMLVSGLDRTALLRALNKRHQKELTAYSQNDDKWAGDLLGFSDGYWNMGNGGCAVTSMAIWLSQRFNITPGQLNKRLRKDGGFYGAEILWHKVPGIMGDIQYWKRRDWEPPVGNAQIAEVVDAIEDGNGAIVELDFNKDKPGQQMHFAVAVKWDPERRDLWIIDPWDGERKWFAETYGRGNDKAEHLLWGLRAFRVTG